MPEYDLPFAAKLAKVADEVDEKGPDAYAARRVTIYMSRLSMEIALKALLEKAGFTTDRIRERGHDLRALLNDLGQCEVEVEIVPGRKEWVPASRVRAETLDLGFVKLPIGAVIDAEDQGGSKYPNLIRYGPTIVDFDPTFVREGLNKVDSRTRRASRRRVTTKFGLRLAFSGSLGLTSWPVLAELSPANTAGCPKGHPSL